MGCIYIIQNRLNGKCYVGLTTRSSHIRWLEHVKGVHEGSSYPVHRAIRKHGFRAFKFKVLEHHESIDDLNAAEVRLVAEHRAFKKDGGYNLTKGGGGIVGWYHSATARKLISVANKGRVRTLEMRKVTSLRTKQAMQDPVVKEKCGTAMRGKKHSIETRKKMSVSRSGKKNPMFGRTGMNHPAYGKNPKHPPWTIKAVNQNGEVVHVFHSLQSARHAGFTPSAVYHAIKFCRPYRGLLWSREDLSVKRPGDPR